MDTNSPNLLQDLEQEIDLVPASLSLRFVNFLVDTISYYILSIGVGALLGIIMYTEDVDPDGPRMQLLLLFAGVGLVLIYYTLFEGATKGKTLGKMATGTIVVKDDGSPITYKDAFLRSLCRFVPFEFLSTLGGIPWHDKWTNTMVIKKRN